MPLPAPSTFRPVLMLLGVVFTAVLQAQPAIPWAADRPLTWADFQGAPPRNTTRDAYTYYGISANFERDARGRVTAEVRCVFMPEKSWVRPPAKASAPLLAHEQLHFDLAELHARRFARDLPDLLVGDDPEAAFQRAHDRMMDRLREEQERYDRDTDHGRDAAAQARWAAEVRRRLAVGTP
ncbi:MAG: DUF922 domain-containing protein [Flavobacteriales bacterium]|nr:hypothetical protein [Flavobacteriales bacterium]MCC6577659.1 DUF922 domain-containing protein [Flavobacteriales bacterium]NUQ16757.1 DUF922 domain-containing protein [Flavobacteriales bacterium]